MQRYFTAPGPEGMGTAIHDSVLNRFVGDGKGGVLLCNTTYDALEIIDVLVQRVGA